MNRINDSYSIIALQSIGIYSYHIHIKTKEEIMSDLMQSHNYDEKLDKIIWEYEEL